MIFVSPTEQHQAFKSDGFKISSLPETMGADFCFNVEGISGFIGIQRKEIKDLVASIKDGRLAKEIGQMEQLSIKVLVIEGKDRWTNEGESLIIQGWTEQQQNGLIFSLQLKKFWVLKSESQAATARLISHLQKYLSKQKHNSLDHRPKAQGAWGKADSREFAVHMLQGLPGVGPEVAGRIYDTFGLCLNWTIELMDLQQIDGIGEKKSIQLWMALNK